MSIPDEKRSAQAERIAQRYGISPDILMGWAVNEKDMENLAKVVLGERAKALKDALEGMEAGADNAEGAEQTEDDVPEVVKEERKTLAWQKSENARSLKERYPTMEIKENPDNTLDDLQLESNKAMAKRYPTMHIKTENG